MTEVLHPNDRRRLPYEAATVRHADEQDAERKAFAMIERVDPAYTPVEKLLAVFDAPVRAPRRITVGSEYYPEHVERVLALLTELIALVGVSSPTEPARQLCLLYQGVWVAAAHRGSRHAAALAARSAAETLVRQALAAAPSLTPVAQDVR